MISREQTLERMNAYRPSTSSTKVSDFIIDYLTWMGASNFFVVQGGCAVHLIDSADMHPNATVLPVQHEQSGAMAADAVSRLSHGIGVAVTTSGPGATNLLTGVCCSYYDSVPTLMITGQVPASHMKRDSGSRQVGFQETDVVSIFASVTKYAEMVTHSQDILAALDRAIWMAVEGRMGPVLLDICDDVQRDSVVPCDLSRDLPVNLRAPTTGAFFGKSLEESLQSLRVAWASAQRPLVIVGSGARQDRQDVWGFLERASVPHLATWAAVDMNSQLRGYAGIFGTTSTRAGNFAIQNADLILALGTRLDSHEVGNDQRSFAPQAYKAMVDSDPSEIRKFENGTLGVDVGLNIEIQDFMQWACSEQGLTATSVTGDWQEFLTWLENIHPSCSEADRQQQAGVNPYFFMEMLSKELSPDAVIIPDCGSNLIWTMQGLQLSHPDQRIFSAWNHSPMGYALPASIGAQLSEAHRQVICITGDGGLQMNIQEFATVERMQLPIKIFVMNNHGHGIVQGTQDQWLQERHVASNYEGGLPDPDFKNIAEGYGLIAHQFRSNQDAQDSISSFLSAEGPGVCVMDMLPGAQIAPKLTAGAAFHDLSPRISPELLHASLRYAAKGS